MANVVVMGGQWGDEGKGKVVDILARRFDIVARWQGGPNAGHTVRIDGRPFFLHQIPAGVLREKVTGVLGHGMVIDPVGLLKEIAELESAGISLQGRLLISNRAHVILPLHRTLDGLAEDSASAEPIGTTRRGIGPAYTSKAARVGLRIVDLLDEETITKRVKAILDGGVAAHLKAAGRAPDEPEVIAAEYARCGRELSGFIAETSLWINERMAEGSSVLFEGAQGTMLDVDLGTYPFVTSSNTVAASLGAGIGVGPRRITGVAGVFKAYTTRVGRGPFPTEIAGSLGELIRERGREYGTTTGRPRRCGWFDGVAARYSATINGVDSIALTLFDVLDTLEEIPVCTGYRHGGLEIREFPAEPWLLESAQPIYEVLPGWRAETAKARSLEDLPLKARRYIERIESIVGCEVGLVSVGADREQTILGPGRSFKEWLGSGDGTS